MKEKETDVDTSREMLTGAQLVVRALEDEGVDAVFGFPGGSVLPLYDALYDSKQLRHILTRHEQGAAHAADGYARTSGRVGVCIATSGPGATNLVTGLANAHMDSVPVVAITGQVAVGAIGKDSFQEADITGITLPITKHSFLVKNVNSIAPTIRKAFHIAATGRPGPVLVDLPKDLTQQKGPYHACCDIDIRGYRPAPASSGSAVERMAEAITASERPAIIAGGGILKAYAEKELLALAEKLDIPVCITLMGKSCFPEDHRLFLGMVGMHGTGYANYAVSESDLIIALGMRFADRVTGDVSTFAPNAKIAHVDIDPAEIGKNVNVDYPVVGDIKEVLAALQELTKEKKHPQWDEMVEGWKQEFPLTYDTEHGLKPQYILEQISDLTEGKAFICTEVGQHQMWAAQYYKSMRPRSFVSSGGLGTMGFGLPASVGVQVANPGETVFDIAGDGSVQMTIQELATMKQFDLPVNIVIMNNRYLGMVRQWQEIFHGRRYSQTDISFQPDFVLLAEAYGIEGIRVETSGEVRPALERAIASPNPCVLDFRVDREENVFPMVPPGGSIKKMLRG